MNMAIILVVGAILLVSAISGWRKGAIRKLEGLVSLLLSAVLVSFLLPYVTGAIRNYTQVDEILTTTCSRTIDAITAGAIKKVTGQTTSQSSGSGEGSGSLGVLSFSRDEIKKQLEFYGVDPSVIDSLSDEELNGYVQQYLPEYYDLTASGAQSGSDSSSSGQSGLANVTSGAGNLLNSMTKIQQTALISDLPLPTPLKKTMLNFNNSEGYSRLNAHSFSEYLAGFFANLILSVAAFLVTIVVAHLIIRGIFRTADLFARLPLLYQLNHIAGLLAGLFEGVMIVWALIMVISLFSGTQIGAALNEAIGSNEIIKPIYDSNLFMNLVSGAITSFL